MFSRGLKQRLDHVFDKIFVGQKLKLAIFIHVELGTDLTEHLQTVMRLGRGALHTTTSGFGFDGDMQTRRPEARRPTPRSRFEDPAVACAWDKWVGVPYHPSRGEPTWKDER